MDARAVGRQRSLALAPATLPRREAIVVDGGIALFAMAIAFGCAILVSLVPAWQTTRSDVIRRAPRPAQAGAVTRGVLVAAQLAFSVVLLVGAGLMARAFVNMRSAPLGFDPDRSASLFVSLGDQRWGPGHDRGRRAPCGASSSSGCSMARADLPGVERAGAGFPVPLTGIAMSQRVSLGDGTPQRETDGFIAMAGYLESLEVPLLAGRYFTRADNSQLAVIVDEHLARELWPGEPAVGRRLLVVRSVSAPLWADVVGRGRSRTVAESARAGTAAGVDDERVRSYRAEQPRGASGDPIGDAARIAGVVQRAWRRTSGARPAPARRLVANASADTRFALFVLGVLAAVAVDPRGPWRLWRRVVCDGAAHARDSPCGWRLAPARGGSWRACSAKERAGRCSVSPAAPPAPAVLARFLESLLFRIGLARCADVRRGRGVPRHGHARRHRHSCDSRHASRPDARVAQRIARRAARCRCWVLSARCSTCR